MATPPPAALLLPEIKVVSIENARHLEKRFAFIWSSAHALLPSSPMLANHMIASMMQLARSNHAQLPQSVLDYICEKCGGLLVPSVSADVRVVSQSRQSPANRRLARRQRRAQLQNGRYGPRLVKETLSTVLRVTCHRCQHVTDRPGASKVHKPKSKKRVREEQDTNEASTVTLKKAKLDEHNVANETKEAFQRNELKTVSTSVFALPPSPPRKLLDGPKRKKKKKKTQPDAAVVAVKSSLSSFLQGLTPQVKKKL